MSLDPSASDWLWLIKAGRSVLTLFWRAITPPKPEIKLKPCLLVVEDDRAQREILHYYLRSLGYRPDVVTTAEAGLALLHERKHQLAFVDIRLPMMSGLELAKLMRKESPQTHVIIMAGYAPDLSELEIGEYVGVIRKPFDVKEVERAIQLTNL